MTPREQRRTATYRARESRIAVIFNLQPWATSVRPRAGPQTRPLHRSLYCPVSGAARPRLFLRSRPRGESSSSPDRDGTDVRRPGTRGGNRHVRRPDKQSCQSPPTPPNQPGVPICEGIRAAMHTLRDHRGGMLQLLPRPPMAGGRARPFAPCRGRRVPPNASECHQARLRRFLQHVDRAAPTAAELHSHGARTESTGLQTQLELLAAQA
jgi:hypothetical protein